MRKKLKKLKKKKLKLTRKQNNIYGWEVGNYNKFLEIWDLEMVPIILVFGRVAG